MSTSLEKINNTDTQTLGRLWCECCIVLMLIYIIIIYFILRSSHSSSCRYKTLNQSNNGKAIEYFSSSFVLCYSFPHKDFQRQFELVMNTTNPLLNTLPTLCRLQESPIPQEPRSHGKSSKASGLDLMKKSCS